jgi:cell division protein FtsI (penicillin-binding protein 3)
VARDDRRGARRDDEPVRRSGLAAARTYRPRGHTVREGKAPRGGDPFRPALALLDDSGDAGQQRDSGPRKRASGTGGRKPAGSDGDRRKSTAGGGRGKSTASGGGRGKSTAGGGGGRKQGTGSGARMPGDGARGRTPRPAAARRRPAAPASPPKLAEPRRRLRLATSLALALFAVLGVRLVELQLTDGPAYAASGLESRLHSMVLPAPRGAIYDREGAVLAHSIEARFVFADPELVEDPRRNAEALAPLLGVPADELAEKMQPRVRDDGQRSRFEWLARGVDIRTADEVMALNLSGIGVDQDERRHVPGNELAANLIGFTGSELAGLAGLEAQFDEVLRGVHGRRTFESGQGGLAREIPGGYRVETPAQPGSHLRLTVDADLQYEVQRVLGERMAAAGASFAAAVVLDTRTFEVLAQASYPGFDAADPHAAPERNWVDAATATVFDPGSAHKPLVFAAALEEGVIGPGSIVPVDPTIRKGDVTFRDVGPWHPPGTQMRLPAIMAYSSNVGTIRIADELGKDALYHYQRAFGLGEATGIGMPAEAAGALLAPEDWSGSAYGSVPIGHSVDTTTLQLATAYAVIANDGTWVRPSLVQAVIAPDGTETPYAEPETRQVISPDTAAQVREIMEAVVSVPNATGTSAAIEGYRVAGKTGTGKLVVDGQYADGEVASFIGMAPAEAPRYVVAVVAHTPGGGGGDVAGPAFQEMMSFALTHYRIPPSDSGPPQFELYG